MEQYERFDDLFLSICNLKENMLKLNRESLTKFKCDFYCQKFPIWKLDLIWQYFWDDMELNEIGIILYRR